MQLAPDSPKGWLFAVLRIIGVFTAAAVACLAALAWMTSTPGEDAPALASGSPELSEAERPVRARLLQHVEHLSVTIGRRNTNAGPAAIGAAAEYVEAQLAAASGRTVRSEAFDVTGDAGPVRARNLIVELPGADRPEEIVIVGAHYDSDEFTPGADDNATGTAGLIELARAFGRSARPAPERTLRFVAFVNEEPPWFGTEEMGSRVHAMGCTEREDRIVAMLSLEMLGFYSDAPDSQAYPHVLAPFYPTTGNFLAFVGDLHSRPLVHTAVRTFRAAARLPAEGLSAPQRMPGVNLSDHAPGGAG